MQSSLFNDTSESDISDLENSVRDFKRKHMNSNIKNYTYEKNDSDDEFLRNDLCTDDEIESVSTEVQKFTTKMRRTIGRRKANSLRQSKLERNNFNRYLSAIVPKSVFDKDMSSSKLLLRNRLIHYDFLWRLWECGGDRCYQTWRRDQLLKDSDDQVYVLVEIVEKLQEISRKFHNYTPSNEVLCSKTTDIVQDIIKKFKEFLKKMLVEFSKEEIMKI
ncbi:hypothetical protein C1646_664895 [Rhizophagus diaphanus]|nr:hypothetical protein C1646_664895 [Rhizophagus diaphanus] [Rhizophagus sp. MUCL 43196]